MLLLALVSPFTAGNHFHHGTLSWELVSGTTVKFWLVSAWKIDFQPFLDQAGGNITVGQQLQVQGLNDPVLEFGDGADSFVIVRTTVVAVDTVMGMWRGEFTVEHTYAAAGVYVAEISGCCRDFVVSTRVDLTNSAALYSPKIAVLPRQVIAAPGNSSFFVAAYDGGLHPSQQGMAGRFQWELLSTMDATTDPPTASTAYSIDAATGLVTAEQRLAMASLSVKVTDTVTNVYSTVDFEVHQLNVSDVEVPAMDPSYPPTRLPLPATNELVASFPDSFRLRFTVPGSPPPSGSWDLQLLSSSLPAGAQLGPVVMAMYSGVPGYEANFSWTPSAEQQGWAVVCVQAVNVGVEPALSSPQYCLDFVVLPDSPPTLAASLPPHLAGLPAGVPLEWSMGQRLSIALLAADRRAVSMDIRADGPLPPGAMFTERVLEESSAELQVMRNLTWEPDAKAGGSSGSLCFVAHDGGAASAPLCFEFRVPKCMYKVRAGETLMDIAMKFGTSWLQLWALNKKTISRPEGHGLEGTVYEGFDLHVGQLVLVKEGDSLERIAARFGTTLRQIVNLNAEVTPSRQLLTGQLLCVVPSSCSERA